MVYEDNFIAFMDATADVADVAMTITIENPYATVSVEGYVGKLAIDLSDPELDPAEAVSAFAETVRHVFSL